MMWSNIEMSNFKTGPVLYYNRASLKFGKCPNCQVVWFAVYNREKQKSGWLSCGAHSIRPCVSSPPHKPMTMPMLSHSNSLMDEDAGIMSEAETSATGFRRGSKQRASLPVVRTPSKTLERPLGERCIHLLFYLFFSRLTSQCSLSCVCNPSNFCLQEDWLREKELGACYAASRQTPEADYSIHTQHI